MITFLMKNKIHLAYGLVMVGILFLLLKPHKPVEVVKTVTKTVDKVKTVNKVVYVDRVTTITKPSGEKVVIVDKSQSQIALQKSALIKESSKIREVYRTPYTLEFMMDPPIKDILNKEAIMEYSRVGFGYQLLDSAVYATASSNIMFNQFYVGVRVEL